METGILNSVKLGDFHFILIHFDSCALHSVDYSQGLQEFMYCRNMELSKNNFKLNRKKIIQSMRCNVSLQKIINCDSLASKRPVAIIDRFITFIKI